MTATQVASSIASVLASRASTPSRIELAIIRRGEQRGPARNKRQRRPIGQQHPADGAQQRRYAIEPDRRARVADAERLGDVDHRGLQPVDADRFLVADLVLIADVDIVAGFHHLLGGLGEPRLRRGRPAQSGKSRAGTRAARQSPARRRRGHARPRHNPARRPDRWRATQSVGRWRWSSFPSPEIAPDNQ